MTSEKVSRANELKRFLRNARARLDPHETGLAASGRRRRTPGLRIEEAATLAGVGLTWYAAFEAGKDIRVSEKTLERIAAALRLNSEEREYLFALARPRERGRGDDDDGTLRPIVDGFTVGPAFVCDRFWNIRHRNALADIVYGHDRADERNLLARLLCDTEFQALHEDWRAVARRMVGIMHLAFAKAPNDENGIATHARLSALSPDFVAWWNASIVFRYEPARTVLFHPILGRLDLLFTSFIASALEEAPSSLMIVVQSPADDATRERLHSTGSLATR